MRRLANSKIRFSCLIQGLLGGILLMSFLEVGAQEVLALEPRSIDGMNNNLQHFNWGSAGIPLLRSVKKVEYADGINAPAGPNRPSARVISNLLASQEGSILNTSQGSDFIWQWGQFLDHDIDLTPEADPPEPFNIPVPTGDPFFDPDFEGGKVIPLNRSIYTDGSNMANPRQQLNLITAFIDGSNVYGSDEGRAAALRTFEGGKLKTTNGGKYLPFNTHGLDNAGGTNRKLYLAGDIRANEQIALTGIHSLFVREHNRLCGVIAGENPLLSDEEIYQQARKIVGAEMQRITFSDFLPVLLGPDAIPPYIGYDPSVNPGISNVFSTAAFRLGHSMLSPTLIRVNYPGNKLVHTSLKDAFFNPKLIHKGGGLASLLRGLATQRAQAVDNKLIDGVRNFLFGEPGEGGFDLAALNIQRGRDHGLANYNSVREAYGLGKVSNFSEVTANPEVLAGLLEAYDSVDDVDVWVGGLAENHVAGTLVGETIHAILKDQFVRLRDGDRFWYQHDPFFTANPTLMNEVQSTTLAEIIRRNTKVGEELQDNVFLVP